MSSAPSSVRNENGNVPIRDASKLFGYSTGYLSNLCRTGKVIGTYAHNGWSVNLESLERFVQAQAERKEKRAKDLAHAREREYAQYLEARTTPRAVTRVSYAAEDFSWSPVPEAALRSRGSRAVALASAFAVVGLGAFAAQSPVIPAVAGNVAAAAQEAASGFNDTFGAVPARIASDFSAASDAAPRAAARVAVANQSITAQIASPQLVAFDFSSALMPEFENALDSRQLGGRASKLAEGSESKLNSAADTTPIDMGAALRAAYETMTSPARIAAALGGAYAAIGQAGYDAILASFSGYLALVDRAGAGTLALAAHTRDTLAHTPALVNRMNLALGEAVIGATHAAIGAEVSLAYGTAAAAPASARATVLAIGAVGDTLAGAAAAAPQTAQRAFLALTAAPSRIAPRIASTVFDAEYAFGLGVVKTAGAVSSGYLALVNGTGAAAYNGVAGTLAFANRITGNAVDTVNGTAPSSRTLASWWRNAYLGALGNGAVAVQSLGGAGIALQSAAQSGFAQLQKNPQFAAALTAAEPTLSIGEQAALSVYEAINGFWSGTTGALAALFNPAPSAGNLAIAPTAQQATSTNQQSSTAKPSPASPTTTYPLQPTASNYYNTTVVQGVSQAQVDQSIAAMRNSVLATVAGMIQPVAAQTVTNVTTIQQINRIERLDGLTVNNGTFGNGTFTGGTFTNVLSVSGGTADFTRLTAGSASVTGNTNLFGSLAVGTSTFFTNGLLAVGTSSPLLYVDNTTGRVGIGTSSPAVAFDLYATDALRIPVGTTLERPAIGDVGYVRYNLTKNEFEGYGTDGTWHGLGGVIDDNQDTKITADTNNANEDYLRFFTSGSERATITNDGRMGVGTTSPWARFAITGTSTDATNAFLVADANDSPLLAVLNNGSIGIGTTSPWGQLSVNPNGITGPAFVVGSSTATNLIVTNAGLVGIGTTSPTAALSVVGDIFATGSTTLTGDGKGIIFTGAGNHDITASGGTLRIGSNTVIGNIQALNNTVSIGTPAVRFDKVYANEINASTLVGTLSAGNLTAETFTINSDNASPDQENAYIAFERGSVIPNALLTWNAATSSKRFEFNEPLFIQSADASTTLPTFTLQSVAGQTADVFAISSSSASTRFFTVTGNGKVGIGTTSPSEALAVDGNGLFTGMVTASNITATGTLAVLGSATAPYFTATDAAATSTFAGGLSAAGTSGLTVLQNGNVGIGTNSPSRPLEIKGTGTSDDVLLRLSNPGASGGQLASMEFVHNTGSNLLIGGKISSELLNGNTSANLDFYTKFSSGSMTRLFSLTPSGATVNDVGGAASNITLNFLNNGNYTSGVSNAKIRAYVTGVDSSTDLAFDTYNGIGAGTVTEKMRITSGGNVGIGTTSPWGQLSVNPNGITGPAFVVGSSTATNFIVTNGGNVGIGTAAPESALHVANGTIDIGSNGTSAAGKLNLIGTNGGLWAYISGDNAVANIYGYAGAQFDSANSSSVGFGTTNNKSADWFVFNDRPFNFTGYYGGVTRPGITVMQYGGNGGPVNLGIGTTSPYSLLSISNSASTAANTPLLTIASTTAGTATSTLMTVLANGNVGIGTTSPVTLLSVAGNGYLTGGLGVGVVNGMAGTLQTSGAASFGGVVYTSQLQETQNIGLQIYVPYNSINPNITVWGGTGSKVQFNTSALTFAPTVAGGWSLGSSAAPWGNAYFSGNVGIGTTSPWGQLSVNPNGISGPAFVVGSSTATNFIVTNGGNVGIGTSNPTYNLYVAGTSRTTGAAVFDGQTLVLNNFGISSGSKLYLDGISNTYISEVSADTMNFVTGANERMRIDSTGNVGIGTTTPNRLLTLANAGASNQLAFVDTGAAANQHIGTIGFSQGQFNFNTENDAYASTTRMVIDKNGNVGIGTDAPVTEFEISRAKPGANTVLRVTNSDSGSVARAALQLSTGVISASPYQISAGFSGLSFGSSTSADLMVMNAAGDLGIGTGPQIAADLHLKRPDGAIFRIESTGSAASSYPEMQIVNNQGVILSNKVATQGGLSSPLYGLSAAGTVVNESQGASAYVVGTNNAAPLLFGTNNAERMRITSAGNVGIGTTSPTHKLEVNGSVQLGGTYSDTVTIPGNLSVATQGGSGYGSLTVGYGNTADYYTSISLYSRYNGSYPSFSVGQSSIGTAITYGTNGILRIIDNTSGSNLERMHIDQNGNVGIGNTNPSYKLDVAGFINTDQYSGFKQAGNTVLYASTTNTTLAVGSGAASWMSALSAQGYSIAVGPGALAAVPPNPGQYYNVAVGINALGPNTTGANNTAVGYALVTNTTGSNNTAVGHTALRYNTTGSNNTAYGISSLTTNTTGSFNTGLGDRALGNNTTGSNNVAVGQVASFYNTSATSITAVGVGAAVGTAGYHNQGGTYLGYYAGYAAATGSDYNTLLGYQSGYDITTGQNNIVLGTEQTTGSGITTGSNNILIGKGVRYGLDGTASNQLNIGNLIFATGLSSENTLSTGNVGIGTTTPNNMLDVYSATKAAIGFSGASGSTYKWTVGEDVSDGGKFKISSSTALGTSDRLVIDGNGNVGIGTASPSYVLDIRAASTSSVGFNIQNTTYSPGASADLYFNHNGTAGSRISSYLPGNNVTNLIFYTSDVSAAPSEKMRIDGSGNVGIGTTNPSNALQIERGSGLGARAGFASNGATISTSGFTIGQDSAGLSEIYQYGANPFTIWTNGSERLRVDGSGNVGIGTTSPNALGTSLRTVSIMGAANNGSALELITNSTSIAGEVGRVAFVTDDSGSGVGTKREVARIMSSTAEEVPSVAYGNLKFYTAGTALTERMRITSAGNVGIGTTSPIAQLSVSKNGIPQIALSNLSGTTKNAQIIFGDNASTNQGINWRIGTDISTNNNTDNFQIYKDALGTAPFTINSSGNVGIGTTSPLARLHVVPVGSASGVSNFDVNFGSMIVEPSSNGNGGISFFMPNSGNAGIEISDPAAARDAAFFYNRTNGWNWQVNGNTSSAAMVLNTSGNVGIGTTNPGSQGSGATGPFLNVLSSGTGVPNTGEIYVGGAGTAANTNIGAFGFVTTGTAAGDKRAGLIAMQLTANSATAPTGDMLFYTNNAGSITEKMRIMSNGNVGIGTTNPNAPLDVGGAPSTGAIPSRVAIVGTKTFPTAGIPADQLIIYDNTAMAAGVGGALSFSGNYQTGGTPVAVYGSIQGIKENGTNGNYAGQLQFLTRTDGGNDTVKMVINNSGNVGIGTTTPQNKLHVAGGNIEVSGSAAAPTSMAIVSFTDVNGTRIGYVGDGSASYNNIHLVSDSGDITITGTGGTCNLTGAASGGSCFSDARLKNVQSTVTGVLSGLSMLDLKTFYWNDLAHQTTNASTTILNYGFIAQDVEKVFPELVRTGADGYKTLDYGTLGLYAVEGVKELDARTKFIENAATSTVLTVDVAGNVGIGTSTPNHTLTVAGDVGAIAFVNTSTRTAKTDISYVTASTTDDMLTQLRALKVATYRYTIEDQSDPLRLGFIAEDAQVIAPEILSPDGKGVDLYKMATFTLASVQSLADKVDTQETRIAALDARLTALESGAISSASGTLSISSSSLASALEGFGVLIQKGIAQFNTLVFRQLVASKDADGTSSAGSVVILAGNTVAQVNNALVLPSTKVFVTFNSQITGSWWVSDKTAGSFRVVLSAPQTTDVSFDYFLVQTEGQIATSTPSGAPSVSQSSGPDVVAPVITLLGDNPLSLAVGAGFTDPGVTVTDDVDGTDPYTVFVDGIEQPAGAISLDTSVETTHIFTYRATDRAGNTATILRSVIVGNPVGSTSTTSTTTSTTTATTTATTTTSSDTTPPVVTLNGAAAMQLTVGDVFTDPGATATDDTDGDLTASITETGAVDTATAGSYSLTYSATDAAGNTGSASRLVTVLAATASSTSSTTASTSTTL